MQSILSSCPCCQLKQNPLYCQSCLREGIALHKELLRNLQARIDLTIQQSQALVQGPSSLNTGSGPGTAAWRELRAEVAAREKSCVIVREKIAERERMISSISKYVSDNAVKIRYRALAAAEASPPALRLQTSLKNIQFQLRDTESRIIHARQVLIREAVDVFGLKQHRSGAWEIAGLILPLPEAFRSISHTLHLLSLITTYLSITLPFTPISPPTSKRHIGRPVVKANLPFVSTTKWRDKHVLWMPSNASVSNKIKSSNITPSSKSPLHPAISVIVAKSASKHKQFLISFALFSFSVAYLAWSQDVSGIGIQETKKVLLERSDEEASQSINPRSRHNPSDSSLISPTSVLQLIHAITLSPTLGHKSHSPGGRFILKHVGFGLDVAKVVHTVLKAEQERWSFDTTSTEDKEEMNEEWHLLDADT
ncbi:uncharacterized protein L203_105753 [Cryptococcus depauperatus CBS 7841]|uniref:Autophagy-related protein 14 n=1 Tax=Cryptococcus depauperatus CBS 7841 TaxID=1295531 RepID=A0AAJ8JXY8_9TREE